MKKLIFAAALLSVAPACFAEATAAVDYDTMVKMLNSKEVSDAVKGQMIGAISVKTEEQGTLQTTTISFSVWEAGWGPTGPSTHPCSIFAQLRNDVSLDMPAPPVIVRKICAMNMPIPRQDKPINP